MVSPPYPLGVINVNLRYTWGYSHTNFSFPHQIVFKGRLFQKCQQMFNDYQLSPLERVCGPLIELESSSSKFVPSLIEVPKWFWRSKKSEKTDEQTWTQQKMIRKIHLSFQLRWANKVRIKCKNKFSKNWHTVIWNFIVNVNTVCETIY